MLGTKIGLKWSAIARGLVKPRSTRQIFDQYAVIKDASAAAAMPVTPSAPSPMSFQRVTSAVTSLTLVMSALSLLTALSVALTRSTSSSVF